MTHSIKETKDERIEGTEKPLPLGFSVMLIRGAEADLTNALGRRDGFEIRNCRIRLAKALSSYLESKSLAPKSSLVSEILITIGEDAVKAAGTSLKIADDWVRSTLQSLEEQEDRELDQ